MLLTDEERWRFIRYLEEEAATDEGMAAQMEKIRVPASLPKKLRAEALAAKVVAAKLRSIESMTVSSEPEKS